MADQPKDYSKLQKFVEAALTNPRHPLFDANSQALKYYATNVSLLGTVTPQQFFDQYPRWTTQLESVMNQLEEAIKQHNAPITEAVLIVTEADTMNVTCPKCGAKFDVKMPA